MLEKKITLERRNEIEPYLSACRHETSGLSFTSLYMWRDANEFEYEICGDYLCISAVSYLKSEDYAYFMMPPLPLSGRYEPDTLARCIYAMKERFEKAGSEFSLRLVPEDIKSEIEKAVPEIKWMEDRPNYDYVYDRKEIEELRGKKFHAKKNYVNSFKKNYSYIYEEIHNDMAREIQIFIDRFTAEKEFEDEEDKKTLLMEEESTFDVFKNFDEAGFIGGAIRVDGELKAISVCGRLSDDTVVEHIEKADRNLRGLYPTILNEMVKHLPEEIEYVNREEDMGIENLRKAKLSFKPVRLIEKYIGKFD